MPAYKMEPNSLANMCKKVIFENINLKKTKNLPQTGLPERTLWLATKELKEKLKNEGSDYTFLHFLLQQSYYYDDIWRSSIFYLADEKENRKLLKKDRKLRNELIEEERKAKKYLFKNDFDLMKGFLEFFHEINKLMFFKLSRNYENETKEFCEKVINETRYLTWKDCRDLKKIGLKTFVFTRSKNEKVQYFQELSSRVKNQDFAEVLTGWMRQNPHDFD